MIHTQHGNVFAPAIENCAAKQRDRVQNGISAGSVSQGELSSLRQMRSDACVGLIESKGGPVKLRQVHQDLNPISSSIFAFV